MNIKEYALSFLPGIIRFIQLQIFITLFSLPIFLAWGLPISLLSPLGNFIFGPVLSLFLLLSSLIFICALLHIPHAWLIAVLEKITQLWLKVMHADCATWLVGFIKPSVIFMLSLPVIALFIMLHPKTGRTYKSIGYSLVALCAVMIYLRCTARSQPTVMHIPCNRGRLTILRSNKDIILIDPGFIGQRINADSWAQYTLIPELIKNTGSNTIDHLIVLQPNACALKALERLSLKMQIKKIYIVYWDGECKRLAQSYITFKKTVSEKNIMIVRIGKKPITVINTTNSLHIVPLKTTLKMPEISYPALMVQGFIDKQEITLYSAKYVKKKTTHPTRKNTINHIK